MPPKSSLCSTISAVRRLKSDSIGCFLKSVLLELSAAAIERELNKKTKQPTKQATNHCEDNFCRHASSYVGGHGIHGLGHPMTVIHGLIPAGGVGARALNAQSISASSGPSASTEPLTEPHTKPLPKQYRLINGVPMLVHAVNALLVDARVQDVVVGVQADDPFAHEYLFALAHVQVWPTAGVTRALTVLQTLQQVGFSDLDWVLVHDAARPGLPNDRLTALIDACLQSDQGGLLAMPAADTVKLAREQRTVNDAGASEVESTLDRARIWLAQTPQMFKVGELKTALSGALKAGVDVTDEASAMEWAGHAPLLVPGSVRNFKVTWPEDFERLGELS